MKNTVVLIGGTFNPFTNAHFEMGRIAAERYPEADIVYVPGNMNFMKEWKDLPNLSAFSGDNRIDVIRRAVKDIPGCMVSDVEATGQLDGKSVTLVRYMKERYSQVIFCMGSDKLEQLPRWYEADEFMKLVDEILLFTRGTGQKDYNIDFLNRWSYKFKEVPLNYPELSSTLVREMFEQKKYEEIQKLVPEIIYNELVKTML